MAKIVSVHADDFQATVQPGIGYKDLNEHLARYGLFFPPDPGANATIGGMMANNAAGIRTVKYGAEQRQCATDASCAGRRAADRSRVTFESSNRQAMICCICWWAVKGH